MRIREIEIIQESYESIRPRMSRITRVLFDRLFELHPELRSLFRADLRDFRRKLVKRMDYIIEHLDQPEVVGPELKALGCLHATHFHAPEGVYSKYIDAFIYALSAAFGSEFTPELRKTWIYVLEVIAQVVQSGEQEA